MELVHTSILPSTVMEPALEKFVVRLVSLKFPSLKHREITIKERKRIRVQSGVYAIIFNDTHIPSVKLTVPIEGQVEPESDLGS